MDQFRCPGRKDMPYSKPDDIESLCGRLVVRMKEVFGSDQRRIDHALSVLDRAETIHEAEGGDPLIIRSAAILHDIGIHAAERKHGSPAGRFQEIEGPPIARAILEEFQLDDKTIDHICRIVGSHHSAKEIDTLEFRTIWDADWLVNIPDEQAGASREELAKLIGRIFKTKRGRGLAEELFLYD